MFALLLTAFVVVPVIEIYLIIQVDAAIGGWETIGLLILDSVIGAWLVRREGFSILARVQGALGRGGLPTNELIDGLLVLVAGALMLTPGFLTDGLGLILLLPPTRALVRNRLKKRFAGRIRVGGTVYVTDVDATDVTVHGDKERGEPPDAIGLGPVTD